MNELYLIVKLSDHLTNVKHTHDTMLKQTLNHHLLIQYVHRST